MTEILQEIPNELLSREDYKSIEDKLEVNLYSKRDLVITKGIGSTVIDINGSKYIDCSAGFGVVNIGHSNPKVIEAIHSQIEELITSPEIFYSPIRARLLQKLIEIAPTSLTQVFLCNSGTEANEAAIKFAKYSTGKSEFICFNNSFHGRSHGSLSATHKTLYREPFEPLVPGFTFVKYNDINAVETAITDNTAGIILELVQGEGGVNPANRDFIQQLRELCSSKNILLIVDEVQTGFGRTGELFASNYYGVEPDIMTVAKSMANGVPIGATLCNNKISMKPSLHGSTFGGNSLACRASEATIEFLVEPGFLNQVKEKAVYFENKLLSISSKYIREIRSVGFMFGIDLRVRSQPFLEKLMQQGIIALPAGKTTIRLLPPLVITYEEIDEVCSKLNIVLNGS